MINLLLDHTAIGIGALAALLCVVFALAAKVSDRRRARRRRALPPVAHRTYAARIN